MFLSCWLQLLQIEVDFDEANHSANSKGAAVSVS
jgi:hypothetical protein